MKTCTLSHFCYDYRENLVQDGKGKIFKKNQNVLIEKEWFQFCLRRMKQDSIYEVQFCVHKMIHPCYLGCDHVSLTCHEPKFSRPSESSVMRHESLKEAPKGK